MATLAELEGADAAAVATARAQVLTYLSDRFPALRLRAGQFTDLVVGPATDALAAVRALGAAQAASLNPETALASGGYDETVLAAALAGRGVTRGAAAFATGTIGLELTNYGVTVPSGFRVYTADGVYYATTGAARVQAPGTAVTGADVAAVALPGGGYGAVVPVKAAATGAAANRPAGTALTAVTPVVYQTGVYLATDAAGGADAETDGALLARLPAATSPRTVASATGTAAVVAAAAPGLAPVSVIGFGHAGMRRGRSALTLQSPGRADARVRVASAPSRVRVPVTATLVATAPYGRWRFTLGPTAGPGRFLIERVARTAAALTTGGYQPAALTYGYDVSAAGAPVDVRTAADAALSAYAAVTVEFLDPDTSTVGLTVGSSTKTYDAVIRTVPGLAAAQAAVEAPGARAAGGDCLVRAAVPVMVALDAVATVVSGTVLTPAQVAAAVAAAVNGNGISQTLSAASVAARAGALLPAGTALTVSTFVGSVYPGAADSFTVSGATGLTVPTDWSAGVGPDAVAYYCDPEAVTASVQTV